MNRLRLIRGLRFAVSTVCGVLCMLLIVLWVRSFIVKDNLRRCNGTTLINIQSYRGELGIGRWAFPKPIPWRWTVETIEILDESSKRLWSPMKDLAPLSYIGVRSQTLSPLHLFAMRYWAPVTLFAALAILPWLSWLRWKFSLRTLFIATTLIAVVLGLAVWSMK